MLYNTVPFLGEHALRFAESVNFSVDVWLSVRLLGVAFF